MKLSVSHYYRAQELSYQLFPLTPEGLKEAVAVLDTAAAKGYRYRLSPSQFDSPWAGQVGEAYRLLGAGDVESLRRHLENCSPQM